MMFEVKDSSRLVDRQTSSKRYDNSYEFTSHEVHTTLKYRDGIRSNCCHPSDYAALRFIVVFMSAIAVVVFVALVIEIISQDHTVQVGDIVTDHPSCSNIGAWILQQGGNAIDAAVGAGFCAAAALPHLASLGGGGVMLIHQTRINKTTVIDFRERSPLNINLERYIENPGIARIGRGSVATPGLLAGLQLARDTYGSHQVRSECCSWFDIVHQTIKLLDKGFPLPPNWSSLVQGLTETSSGQPTTSADLLSFIKNGAYSSPSSPFTKQLHGVLQEIVHDPQAFYHGNLGRRLAHDLKNQLVEEDLTSYGAVERSPLSSRIEQYQVLTPPPPFSGAGLLGILNSLTLLNSSDAKVHLTKLQNIIERVMEEEELLGDPDQDIQPSPKRRTEESHETFFQGEAGQEIDPRDSFSISDRTKYLIDKRNARNWMSSRQKYGANSNSGNGLEEGTSILVTDNQDNYVSLVLSVGSSFGSQVFSQGILMNNALSSFDIQSGDREARGRNYLSAGVRPLSYATPAIIIDRKVTCGTRLVVGAAAPEAIAQVLSPFLMSVNADLVQLVAKPRLLHRNSTVSAESKFVVESEDIQKSSFPGYPVNILEKTRNTVIGLADKRAGAVKGRWVDLGPKFV